MCAFMQADPIYFVAMLQLLSIQNYATVDSLEIEFDAGMSVNYFDKDIVRKATRPD